MRYIRSDGIIRSYVYREAEGHEILQVTMVMFAIVTGVFYFLCGFIFALCNRERRVLYCHHSWFLDVCDGFSCVYCILFDGHSSAYCDLA